MKLHVRISLVITLLIITGAGFGSLLSVLAARAEVQRELRSSGELVTELTTIVEQEFEGDYLDREVSDMMALLQRIEQVRHLNVTVFSAHNEYPQLNLNPIDEVAVPGWFIRLVAPQGGQLLYRFILSNGDEVHVSTDPSDEVTEVWRETRLVIVYRLLVLLIINTLVCYFVKRWLAPIDHVVDALSQLEIGQYQHKLPRMELTELRLVAERINRLAEVLGASKIENDRLARKALTIQEQERRLLARELHDSLGQTISAIKAIAVSVEQRIANQDAVAAQSVLRIEDIADKAYQSVRALMHDLRPPELDDFGLAPALEQMVDDWNDCHEDTLCHLSIDGNYADLDEQQQINLYRIVQEALTNVAKYAQATVVHVRLSGNEVITLLIQDDGKGFDWQKVVKGMGMQNLKDRVLALQGVLSVHSAPLKGVTINIEFPRQIKRRRRASDRV